uniref:Uncharacterized protein n=1 Tax=viral metagenome TaxID=1070528 RepID=A0A6C0AX85_9ZZZZ|tara:strand:+ start:13471 stop:13857 length:387 start_codon:yes stop_codon:yes gene_type:complete
MDIAVEPEIYCPIIDEKGNYIDKCPALIKYGIKCPCGTREDWIYNTKNKFKNHISGIKHKKWIEQLNNNKLNFYENNIKLKETVKNQREIIARMEKEIISLKSINSYIESKIFKVENNQEEYDLLDIN